jgi:hypothetical protein
MKIMHGASASDKLDGASILDEADEAFESNGAHVVSTSDKAGYKVQGIPAIVASFTKLITYHLD